jgi:hypothetical protein
MAVLINIVLAIAALVLYVVASRRFYRKREPFLGVLALAVVLDVGTALLASFKLTPTTTLAGPHRVPWTSVLFITHMTAATLGMFGFIIMLVVLLIRGTGHPYTWLRKFQYRVMLPAWILGTAIALTNSVLKIVLKTRIYDLF